MFGRNISNLLSSDISQDVTCDSYHTLRTGDFTYKKWFIRWLVVFTSTLNQWIIFKNIKSTVMGPTRAFWKVQDNFLTTSYTQRAVLGIAFRSHSHRHPPFWKICCILRYFELWHEDLKQVVLNMDQIESNLIKQDQTWSNLFKLD